MQLVCLIQIGIICCLSDHLLVQQDLSFSHGGLLLSDESKAACPNMMPTFRSNRSDDLAMRFLRLTHDAIEPHKLISK